MPNELDPSIITRGMRPVPAVDPFAILQQVGDLRAQQQNADWRRQQIASQQAFEEDRRLKIAKEQQAQDEQVAAESAWQGAFTTRPDGVVTMNRDALAAGLVKVGQAHTLPMILSKLDEFEKTAVEARKATSDARSAGIEAFIKSQDAMAHVLDSVELSGFTPASALAALKVLGDNEIVTPDTIKAFTAQLENDSSPETVRQLVDRARVQSATWRKQQIEQQNAATELPGRVAESEQKRRTLAGTNAVGMTAAQQNTADETARHNRIVERRAAESENRAAKGAPVQIMGPNGVPIWVRASDAIGQPAAHAARAVTGAERQALSFYNRAKEAVETVTPLEDAIGKKSLAGQARLQIAPNWLQSPENQSYRQAQRAFTEARLRKESGAAIPTQEYENDAKTYFAQPGDTPKMLEQKRKARETLLDGFAFSAGKAYDEFYGQSRKDDKTSGGAGVSAVPVVGGTFNGGTVLKVTPIK